MTMTERFPFSWARKPPLQERAQPPPSSAPSARHHHCSHDYNRESPC
jgi:hypothetical protein